MVGGEGGFEAIYRQPSLGEHHAGVVEEDVDGVVAIQDLGRPVAHRRQAGEIEQTSSTPVVALRAS